MTGFVRERGWGKTAGRLALVLLPVLLATACATADIPDGRSVQVPATAPPLDRYEGLNEKRDPVTQVRLGRDILVPQPLKEDLMPEDEIGPYELRGETLASALQLILDDYDISLAFESDEGLKRRITVSNLHGKLRNVVNRVCALADLYCHFEGGTLTVKATETFVVDLPPIGGGTSSSSSSSSGTSSSSSSSSKSSGSSSSSGSGSSSGAYSQIASGLAAVINSTPVVDNNTRVMIYTATQRTNKYALQYFERLRKNTALIIFETHIWEVALNNDNRTGIKWDALFDKVGSLKKIGLKVTMPGGAPAGGVAPISITPTYTGSGNITTTQVLEFISSRGAVKTVSQPQITVLSGSSAHLAVSQQENYVSGVSRTPSTSPNGSDTVSTTTATVNTGLTMDVTSAWDQSTVYGNLNLTLDDLLKIDEFKPDDKTTIQLPQTTKRTLQTEIRVRPGDAILIGGLVSEKDDMSDSGPGFIKPLFATSRGVSKKNTELVFLLRPRVVAFVKGDDSDTPPIAEAPAEGIGSKDAGLPDITDKVKNLFGPKEAPPPENPPPASLPAGMSPDALAPQKPAAAKDGKAPPKDHGDKKP